MPSSTSISISHFKPRPMLENYVRKISLFQSKNTINYRQKLTPSAFMYFTYHHADIPPNIIGGNKINPEFRLQIDGPKINDDVFIEYSGKLNRILVEFSASGFYYLFHSSPSDYIDQLVNLNNIISSELVEELESELQSVDDPQKQIELIQDFLLELVYKAIPYSDYIENALQLINKQFGHITVNQLIDELGISKRQFNRRFSKIVGLSPKQYSKMLQLHYIINMMSLKKYSSMQEIANNSEFYDLAHFSRGFKELTGFSPGEFIKSNHHIALKYFTDLIK